MPTAVQSDWELLNAGQRAQIIKKDSTKGGVLQFGTEIITSADGSISGLLGASPGASTAVYAMLEVIKKSFPSQYPDWEKKFKDAIPALGNGLNQDPEAAALALSSTASTLKL